MRTPPRILVADDNPTNLEVLRVRLNAHGYEVVTAVDGEDALGRARELEPDLVLLDIMIPRLDGIAILKELKGRHRTSLHTRHPVIVRADTRDIVSGLEAGGDDYLAKPFEQALLCPTHRLADNELELLTCAPMGAVARGRRPKLRFQNISGLPQGPAGASGAS